MITYLTVPEKKSTAQLEEKGDETANAFESEVKGMRRRSFQAHITPF